jgi:magnesium chelatase family protein
VLGRAVTFALVGLEPRRVEVEAHLRSGQQPSFSIVGLADRACQEAKHRVRSGVHSALLKWPERVITVNLAPAALRKEGTGFDLAIALTLLAASEQVPAARLAQHACVGELGLDGRVRPVAGMLAAAEGAARAGIERVLCPAESAGEAALAGVEAIGVRHLVEAVGYLLGHDAIEPAAAGESRRAGAQLPDLGDVRGQERGRRALELAAAGAHNLLLAGPPGTGKTMLARRLPSILPALSAAEALEVTRIHSIAGTLPPGSGLVAEPPFRAPHHGASAASVVGGGVVPRPGEVSLAHRGVLLLDELPEFPRSVLEALRQPLEDGVVSVARVGGRALFPARFRLVATVSL